MHVDTGHNLDEVIEFRDRTVARLGVRLLVGRVQDDIDAGRVVEETGPRASRNRLQTVTLLRAIQEHRFDAVFGGARRDEEKARAKERVFSFRDEFGQWDPRNQRPGAVEPLQRVAPQGRAHPGLPAVQLDRAGHLAVHPGRGGRAALALLRPPPARCSNATACCWPSRPTSRVLDGEEAFEATVRFRTIGDATCTGCVESAAFTAEQVVVEVAASRLTERGATRADDRISEAGMEDRKKEGYF